MVATHSRVRCLVSQWIVHSRAHAISLLVQLHLQLEMCTLSFCVTGSRKRNGEKPHSKAKQRWVFTLRDWQQRTTNGVVVFNDMAICIDIYSRIIKHTQLTKEEQGGAVARIDPLTGQRKRITVVIDRRNRRVRIVLHDAEHFVPGTIPGRWWSLKLIIRGKTADTHKPARWRQTHDTVAPINCKHTRTTLGRYSCNT